MSVDLGFGEPAEWYPEEPEDIAATIRFIAVMRDLIARGAAVDCIGAWPQGDGAAALAGTIDVDLSGIGDQAFRFFENHRFVFSGRAQQAPPPG
jgi:hypothetical protein